MQSPQPPCDQSQDLAMQVAALQKENCRLTAENQDLKKLLATVAEHGDMIELQLCEANEQLQGEVAQHQRTQASLKALIAMISKERDDLEIVVQTIVEHGDITDAQWHSKLRETHRLAELDSLTQIANRRCFDRYLHQQWFLCGQNRQVLTLLLCDIDYFKRYNDTYGHLAGDDCLRRIAQSLTESCRRPEDLATRFGGEEFAVILPDTDPVGGQSVAQRIQTAIATLNIPHAESGIAEHVTLSIGLASTIPDPNQTIGSLIASADQAMYHAKQSGKNRIVHHLVIP